MKPTFIRLKIEAIWGMSEMKHHIASPGVLGTGGREHRALEQITHGGLQRTPLAHKSAEPALAELSVSPHAHEQRGAQIADVVPRKRPSELLLSEVAETARAASPGTHESGHPQAQESEALRGRRARPPARKTKNA
jgi:hypothetical protein